MGELVLTASTVTPVYVQGDFPDQTAKVNFLNVTKVPAKTEVLVRTFPWVEGITDVTAHMDGQEAIVNR